MLNTWRQNFTADIRKWVMKSSCVLTHSHVCVRACMWVWTGRARLPVALNAAARVTSLRAAHPPTAQRVHGPTLQKHINNTITNKLIVFHWPPPPPHTHTTRRAARSPAAGAAPVPRSAVNRDCRMLCLFLSRATTTRPFCAGRRARGSDSGLARCRGDNHGPAAFPSLRPFLFFLHFNSIY